MGLYTGVLCIELERLSRGDGADQQRILKAFQFSDTKIITLTKTYDLAGDDSFDEEFFEFGLFMSRREYKMIKKRLYRGRIQAQKEGYFIGSRPPYGYNKERIGKGYVLVPNENAVPILTKVVEEMHTLEPKEQNDLLKMIIDRIEYEKTESGASIEPTLRISLKI